MRPARRAGEGRAGRRLITSRDNEKLKLVRKLHERRWREKLGLFFVEGEDQVEAAGGVMPVELLVAGENVEASLLAEVSTAAHPPRVIGVYRRDDLPRVQAHAVTLELRHVTDPGNVGTLVRTADAFDASVALLDDCADPTGPKAVRASAGSLWRVPLVEGGNGRRVALVAHGGVPLGEVDLSGEVTFVLGAERAGLAPEVPRDVDAWIPIGGAESLNVGVAGAIALYERRRQMGT